MNRMTHTVRLLCLFPVLTVGTPVGTPVSTTGNGARPFRCPFPTPKPGDPVNGTHNLVWCLPQEYEKEKPPVFGKHKGNKEEANDLVPDEDRPSKLHFYFNFDIREVSEVNDKTQTLSIPMYFSVQWREARLWINESAEAWNQNITGPKGEVNVDPVIFMENSWEPDLEIYGLDDFGAKSVLKKMSGLRIHVDKMIEYNTRVTVKVSCRMMFDNFPFDSQKCLFQVGSYFYGADIVDCNSTYTNPKIANDDQENIRQRNLQHEIEFFPLEEKDHIVTLQSGRYAACGFKMTLKRKWQQLFSQVYLPCMLFVMVSFVSFLIRPDVVPGRMALLLTLFLVLVNIFNTVRQSAPFPSSKELNSLDEYMVVSIFMVFIALVEYAIVLTIIKLRDMRNEAKQIEKLKEEFELTVRPRPQKKTDNSPTAFLETTKTLPRKRQKTQWEQYKVGQISINHIDFGGLIVLPLFFLMYNLYYWTNALY